MRAIVTFIVTIIVGYLGCFLLPELGIIFSIATAGAFIVHAIVLICHGFNFDLDKIMQLNI